MPSMPAFGQNRSLDPSLQIVKNAPEEHLVIEIVEQDSRRSESKSPYG